MSVLFNEFITNNNQKISAIADRLKDFKIDAQKIGIRKAKKRTISWLENFDKIGFTDLDIPLYLLDKIEFISSDHIQDKVIKLAADYITQDSSFIVHLGEKSESSYRITAGLNRHPNFYTSINQLLNDIPKSKKNKILFFDDFLNSGGQIVSIFYSLFGKQLPDGSPDDESSARIKLDKNQVDKIKNSEIHLFYYLAFDEGAKIVDARLKTVLGLDITIHAYAVTNKNDSAFGDEDEQENIEENANGIIAPNSIYAGKKYSDLYQFYKVLKDIGATLLQVNEPKWSEKKINNRALGYGNLGRLLVTDNNIPTISLTALWQNGKIEYEGKEIYWNELIPRTKKILPKTKLSFTSKASDNTIDFNSLSEELQALYENDEFREGLKKAESNFELYGAHPKLLKHVFRFNMRDKNWARIAEIINELDDLELTDDQKALCRFTLFECSLREAYEFRSNTIKFSETIRALRKHLNHVPITYKNSPEYHYLEGRWHLEMWWAHRSTNNLINLAQALSSFNLALSLKNNWWTHCYKCIVLKLLNRKEFHQEARSFEKRIFEVHEKKPLQPSVKIYCITAFIFTDKMTLLKKFLNKLNQQISPTDFEDTLIHRVEMIYHTNKSKQASYKKTIQAWIASLPRK